MRSAPFVLAALMGLTQAKDTTALQGYKDDINLMTKELFGKNGKKLVAEYNKNKVGQVMQGVLEAFGGHFDLYALLICIYDEDQAALMFDVAVQEFETAYKQKSVGDAIGGIIASIAGVKQVISGLPACEAVWTKFDFKPINQCVDAALDPVGHFEIIEKDILFNGKSILKDAELAVQAFQVGDFKNFGLNLGNIMKLGLSEQPKKVAEVPKVDNRTLVAEFM